MATVFSAITAGFLKTIKKAQFNYCCQGDIDLINKLKKGRGIVEMDQEFTDKTADAQSKPPDTGFQLEKRITEAFEIFDHSGNKTVDVREVGTILRSLGCCPTEEEIQEILVKVEDHETSSVKLGTFLKVVIPIITERKLQPAPPELLLKAFHTLDKEGKGYITKEYLTKLIKEEGEPFTQEELDELLAIAVDSDTGNILYEYYINQIMVHTSNPDLNVYALIPRPQPVQKKTMNLAAFL